MFIPLAPADSHQRDVKAAFFTGFRQGYAEGLKAQPSPDDGISAMLKRVNAGEISLDDAVDEMLEDN